MQNCYKKCRKGFVVAAASAASKKSGCGGKHIEELSTGKRISNLTENNIENNLCVAFDNIFN